MSIDPVQAIAAQPGATTPVGAQVSDPSSSSTSFGDVLSRGLGDVENRIDTANDLVRRFALDQSVPIHEVTVALEEARLAVELTLQVRTHLLDGYRQIINMQL